MPRIMRINEYGHAVPHIRETRSEYVGIMSVNGYEQEIPINKVAGLRETIGKHNAHDLVSVKVENRPYVIDIPECSYCAARPVTGEYDCDGFYWNATCDSDQCVKGDVRRGRRNLSASNRARGFDG